MNHRLSIPAPDPRREFLGSALLGLAAGSVMSSPALAGTADPDSRSIKALSPPKAPAAATGYSPGVVAEGRRVVFVSGQGPADLKADMEAQIRQTFDRIGLVLRAGGAS